MILNELAQSNTLLLITAKDLMEFGRQLISQAKLVVELEKEQDVEEMLNASEASKELKKSTATLRRWSKAGYLEAVYVGGTPMYRRSDIERVKNGK